MTRYAHTGPNVFCCMCGQQGAEYRYHENGCIPAPGGWLESTKFGDGPDPHQHRTCVTCGYQWVEQTS